MKARWSVVALSLGLVSCGDGTGPAFEPSGVFTLVTVHGLSLPATVASRRDMFVDLLDATIDFRQPDRGFVITAHYRTTYIAPSGEQVVSETTSTDDSGRWSEAGGNRVLLNAYLGGPASAAVFLRRMVVFAELGEDTWERSQ